MEQARRKLRICLICVVFAAVLAGIAYYYYEDGKIEVINRGTLVRQTDTKITGAEEANWKEKGAAEEKELCQVR
ncbi:hypothetical protein KFE17_07905 [Faecalicatena sp. Marseille-Q4148]|nr:hypothetical protein KFE17_07905 [Faecalicatena sp. Marseille-Q4148]